MGVTIRLPRITISTGASERQRHRFLSEKSQNLLINATVFRSPCELLVRLRLTLSSRGQRSIWLVADRVRMAMSDTCSRSGKWPSWSVLRSASLIATFAHPNAFRTEFSFSWTPIETLCPKTVPQVFGHTRRRIVLHPLCLKLGRRIKIPSATAPIGLNPENLWNSKRACSLK
jgi:hypothetical protein